MTTAEEVPTRTYEKYRVSVEQYRTFREQGFLKIKGLLTPEDVQDMNDYMDDMLAGRRTLDGAIVIKGFGLKPESRDDWSRAHMLHRISPMHERYLLHPRVLDALEALIGPDVLALQSMLFFKRPGQPGQGYHQDSYYLPTFPDTLCGAWQALTPATLENGCLWFAKGSQHEPVYPDKHGGGAALTTNIADLGHIENPSNNDFSVNTLSRIVDKYKDSLVPVEAEPGDVVFFGGHIIHWSFSNRSDIPRRAYVGHYCNARSLVLWNHGERWEGDQSNYLHILARGDSHLPYAQPTFGTPCAANQPKAKQEGGAPKSMMGMEDGMMGEGEHPEEDDHDH
jgi:phytanoyl-CoA hydroxylase